MTMREIPRREWRSFLERFSRDHRAWLGTMHWVSGKATVTSAQGVAVESIRVDPSGEIVGLCFLHGPAVRLERSCALRIEQTDQGAERALEIETATGGLLRLAFRATALPEELDGMAPGEVFDVVASPHIAQKQPRAA